MGYLFVGELISLLVYVVIKVCSANTDVQTDCTVVCNEGHNSTCCDEGELTTDDDKSVSSTTVVVFFVGVIGSLTFLMTMMYCCIRMNKCPSFSQRYPRTCRSRRGDISTSSACVQTTSSELPPPYVWTTESSNLSEVSIPRCPSYVKDPPKYGVWITEACTNDVQSQDDQTNSSATANHVVDIEFENASSNL